MKNANGNIRIDLGRKSCVKKHHTNKSQEKDCKPNNGSIDYQERIVFNYRYQNANDHKLKKSDISKENSSYLWLSHKPTKNTYILNFKFPKSHVFSPLMSCFGLFKVFGEMFYSLRRKASQSTMVSVLRPLTMYSAGKTRGAVGARARGALP